MNVKRWFDAEGISSLYIPYGSSLPDSSSEDTEILRRIDVRPGEYFLFAGRLVSEKGPHTLIEAFVQLRTDKSLLIVGDAPEASRYIDALKKKANDRVHFLGYVYGDDYHTLRRHALASIQPSTLEGTSISLLDALSSGRPLIASDIAAIREVAGEAAIYFRAGSAKDLRRAMESVLVSSEDAAERVRKHSARLSTVYDWDEVASAYESLYHSLLRNRGT